MEYFFHILNIGVSFVLKHFRWSTAAYTKQKYLCILQLNWHGQGIINRPLCSIGIINIIWFSQTKFSGIHISVVIDCQKLIVNNSYSCHLVSHDNLLALILHIFWTDVCMYQLYLKRVTQNSKLTNLRPSIIIKWRGSQSNLVNSSSLFACVSASRIMCALCFWRWKTLCKFPVEHADHTLEAYRIVCFILGL